MDASRFMGSQFLKVKDLEEGPITAKIIDVEESEKYDKLNLILDSGDTLSLNVTNCCTLVENYGSETNDWIGHEIELAAGVVEYKNERKESITLTPISPPTKEKKPITAAVKDKKKKPPREDLNDEIPDHFQPRK